MAYRENSKWNDLNELKCLLIYKILDSKDFPRNKQSELCKEMELISGLNYNSISAKISNYKSVAGINHESNASKNTKEIYKKYNKLSIQELELLINDISKK